MSVFNGGRFLSEAVESVLSQSFDEFEFIIIDDGSDDESLALLDRYRSQDSRIRLFAQSNRGLVESLNRGCDLARGRYIARMDADDVALLDRLKVQVEFLESHPEISLVGGAVEFIDADGKALLTARHPESDFSIKRQLSDCTAFWHPTVLYTKDAFLFAGGYRNIPDAEDYDLWLRMADHFELANLKQVVLRYRVHPEQGSVLRCRKQALGTLAAKASAAARRSGACDPLALSPEITAAALASMGVDDRSIHTAIGRAYLSSARNMYRLRAFSLALAMLATLQSADCERADGWVIADSYLYSGRIYWSQGRYFRGLMQFVVAIFRRPILVGRPLHAAVKSLGAAFSDAF
nr:glycosyltransferase [Granulicella sp. dw_53]